MKTETLQGLYLRELHDLCGSEKLLLEALPKLAAKAELPEIHQALIQHLARGRSHVSRLERLLQLEGEKPAAKRNKGLEGILEEADEDVASATVPSVRDAAILGAADQIGHYEISAYGTLHSYAVQLGHAEAVRLLQETLDEERAAVKHLAEIALSHLRVEATPVA